MSKIEEALRKARSVGTLRGRSPGSGTALQAITPASTIAHNERELTEDVLAEAHKQLARMGDAWFLSDVERAESRIIHPEMKDERVANAFRDLRTKIVERSKKRNCSVVVCGVSAHCGASFVALNLGVAFSFDESRTALLVDCNIAKPAYGGLLKKSEAPLGITDFFENDDVKIEQIIHPVGIRKLRMIPAGSARKGAVEYFTSNKVRALLKGVKRRYPDRYVIINAPPVTDSADTRILAELADLVLLVVAYGSTTEQSIITAAKSISPEKLLGVVFNDAPQLPKINWKSAISQGISQFFHSLIPSKKNKA